MFQLVKKFKAVNPVLKQLNKDRYSDIENNTSILQLYVQKLQEELGVNPANTVLIEEEHRGVQDLKHLVEARNSFLAQKAKITWINEGDANTTYFHGAIKQRRVNNKVVMIENQNGKMCASSDQIQEAFLHYYQSLLGTSTTTSRVRSTIIKCGKVCTEEQYATMLTHVTNEEIKAAPFRPDGYTSKFFKDAWEQVGGEVIEVVKDFFRSRKLLKKINATNLTLITKCEIPQNVLQFRPIACYNVIYKVVSKLLCTRIGTMKYAAAMQGFKYHLLCKEMNLTNLMFVNDVLMFCKGDATSMMQILKAFSTFSNTSGLKVSAAKSHAYFNGVADDLKEDILKISGFREGGLPFKYLGMPIQSTRLKRKDCDILIEKVCNRIHGLGARKLCYAGRLVLVKAILNTLHSYWASIFILPKGVIRNIEAICKNYLWDSNTEYKRASLVSWATICRPKEEGGLGIKDQIIWNQAMVGKLVYIKDKEWLTYSPSYESSWAWRKICKIKEDITAGYVNGNWFGQTKGYSAAECYDWLRDKHPKCRWAMVVWNSWSMPKHAMLAWLISKEALNTKDKLLKTGVCDNSHCCMCEQAEENQDHLFYKCSYSNRLINAINNQMGMRLPESRCLEWCKSRRGTKI
ncbi:uncharacterized protein LOC141639239 [Silene latifolia]|uniref:uncharacterized protein LOC141639239 n=1 Tax=Silene latifolia TaxID=37657 RepID=UPI003D77DF7B